MTSFFDNPQIPDDLVTTFLAGATSKPTLLSAIHIAHASGMDQLTHAFVDATFALDPFDKNVAAQALQFMSSRSDISSDVRAMAHLSSYRPDLPEDRYLHRLIERRDFTKILDYLEKQIAKTDDACALDRIRQFVLFALGEQQFERAASLLEQYLPDEFSLWHDIVFAEMALLETQAEKAVRYASQAWSAWPNPRTGLVLTESLLQLGDRDRATDLLRQLTRSYPWLSEAVLRLYDLTTNRDMLRVPLEGDVHIALYTYNKATDLDSTLKTLAQTDWSWVKGRVCLTVLNNASTDTTADIMSAWAKTLSGHEHVTTQLIHLPINIGAPAARNWLMSLDETRAATWCAYLDDDALIPSDWLGRFGAAVSLYPDAGVYGCRVRDHIRQGHVQSADVFLIPETNGNDANRRFHISTVHLHNLDMGIRTYMRPCATVTGCCHLFKTDILLGLGGFDIRYSPSQYDDLDHDIRLLLSDKTPVYQGHLAIEHLKSTGREGAAGGVAHAMGVANQVKLHHKYSMEEIQCAAQLAFDAAKNDLVQKSHAIEEMVHSGPKERE